MATVDYGIKSIEFLPALPSGEFQDFDSVAGVKLMKLTVLDSFQEDKDDDQTTDLSVEELDTPILRLAGEKGLRTITFQSYDLSEEDLAYFMGYKNENGWAVEDPNFVLPAQAMRLTTRKIDIYPAKEREWAKLDVRVKRAGTTGKNGLPYIQFDITVPANLDNNGKAKPGYRERLIDSSDGYSISVSDTNLGFIQAGEEKEITVNATKDGSPVAFEYYYKPSWITVTITGNKAKIKADANTGGERSDFVRFRPVGSIKSASTKCTQAGTVAPDYVFTGPSSLASNAAGETKTGTITSMKDGVPVGWSVQQKESWTTVTGIGTGTINVVFSQNTGGARSGKITLIQDESGEIWEIIVSQAAASGVSTYFRFGWDTVNSHTITQSAILAAAKTTRENPKAGDTFNVLLNPGGTDTWRRMIVEFPATLSIQQFQSIRSTQTPQFQFQTLTVDGIQYTVGTYLFIADTKSDDEYAVILKSS